MTSNTQSKEFVTEGMKKLDQEKEETYLSIIKESFLNVCSNTTGHALPNICRTENILIKVFWFILFLAGFGLSIYYFYFSIYSYFQYEVAVSVSVYDEDLSEFPAVTICNMNPFDYNLRTVQQFFNTTIEKNNISTDFNRNDDVPVIYQVRQSMRVIKAAALSESNNNSSYAETLGFSIENMLISCYFDGDRCSKNDFIRFYSFEFGNCYTFNKKNGTNPVRLTGKAGPGSGLSLELYIGYPGKQEYFMEKKGIYVAVHNKSQIPLTKFEGTKIPSGFASDISIKRTFYDRLPDPFSDCRKDTSTILSTDSEFYKKTMSVNKYSKKLCYEICLQDLFIIPGCNCSDPSVPITNTSQRICLSLLEFRCINDIRKKFDSTDMSLECGKYCPSECDQIIYETNLGLMDYPTTYYYNVISKQQSVIRKFSSMGSLSYSTFKESVLMVNIFYEDLKYTNITESQLYTVDQVLGVIGGQAGLFLGISVLTLFEPVEFLIDAITNMILLKMKTRVKRLQPKN